MLNMKIIGLLILLLCVIAPAPAQVDLPTLDDSEEADTLFYPDSAVDTSARRDTAETAGYVQSVQGPKKLKIIRRAYNYREQLALALGMMAFVAVIFTTVQNWNPEN